MARTFFPMPTEYEEGMGDDALSRLSDVERKRFLDSYAPSPIHTGAVSRGVQEFSPLAALAPQVLRAAPEGAGPAAPTLPPAPPDAPPSPARPDISAGIDPDLMRRFAEAQVAGQRAETLGNLGASLDNYGRLYAGLSERPTRVPDSVRRQPVNDVLEAESLAAKQRATSRQQELDTVNLAKTKAETKKAEASAAATEADATREAALADPASSESAALRATASSLLVDQFGEPTISPDKLATMSGVQIRDALKFGTSRLNAADMAGIAQQRVNNERHANEVAAWLRKEGLDTQYDIAKLGADVRESEGQKTRELQELLAKYRVSEANAKAERDRSEKLAERNVGGWTFSPDDPPTAQATKQMQEATISRDEIIGSLNRLEALYDKHGPKVFGEAAGEMETEWMNVTNRLRTLNEMGVPNGADYLMLAKQIQDPTSPRAQFTTRDRAKAQFRQLRDQVRRKVDATARALKYSPRSGTQASPARSNPTYETHDGKPVEVDDLPTGRSAPKPAASGSPALSPSTAPVQKLNPGQKLVDVVPEGEYRKVPMGEGKYRIVVKRGGKLKIVEGE